MGCQLSGGSRGGPGPPSFLDQSESRRALKKFLETAAPVPLSKGLDDWGPTPLCVTATGLRCSLKRSLSRRLSQVKSSPFLFKLTQNIN